MNMPRIKDVLNLQRVKADHFVGESLDSHLERTFGGQVAAQALVAAIESVNETDPKKSVHSLHGYFIRPGKPTEPTEYLVHRYRDGRSFATRQVQAVQEGESIFSMQASFHIRDDEGLTHSEQMRTVPAPEEVEPYETTYITDSRVLLNEWDDWDVRVIGPNQFESDSRSPSQQVVWFKAKRPLPDDEQFHLCSLAYMSDMTLLHSALVPHAGHTVQMASLDHAIWFLRPFRVDDWLLYDQSSPSASGGRSLTQGRIFDREGNLVAMVMQEGLTRTFREKPGA